MTKDSPGRFDVLVIGGGPAGVAAAVRSGDRGRHVGIVDDNPALGGQIWRGEFVQPQSGDAAKWSGLVQAPDISKFNAKTVFSQPQAGILLAEGADGVIELRYEKLILATGARERFLPFPGWTLPNVTGAGGLQAMVKSGLPIRGKRVVVAGSGPLLLAVAAYLRKKGAEVLLVCEQASWPALAAFGLTLASFPEKLRQASQLRKQLAGIPFAANSWPVSAQGSEKLASVTISRAGKLQEIACDYLACGIHLVPNIELPLMLGCKVSDGFVPVDEWQQTSVPDIFCAGELTGIGGIEQALIEGEIAGLAAVGETKKAKELFAARKKTYRFARALKRTFELRPELKNLPKAETIVCRCEDVPYSKLKQHSSWRAAKLHTRCGMGPCQGRVCGPAVKFLFGWNPDSVRPPVFPARVESLATSNHGA
jgi:NADPH-dependent 2,4-dienoyl-CoA reductase/sulfur reductase-like enzyme